MPRPPAQPLPAASSSSTFRSRNAHPVHALYPLFAGLTFHIVPAKLEDDLQTLYSSVDELGGRNVRIDEARIVVTALKGKARLVRSIGQEWIETKPILSVQYITDTFQLALDYASFPTDEPPHLPDREDYLIRTMPISKKRSAPLDFDAPLAAKRGREGRQDWEDGIAGLIDFLPDMEVYPEDMRLEDIPRMCVERPSPLVAVNQDMVDAIKPIYEDREFEESQQKNSNVLSYRRSMSILKSVPRRIRSGKEARKLQDVGEKVAQRIDEFLETGRIAESEDILASSRHKALVEFASVYTIGVHTAKELYDTHHCRTLEDVRQHYLAVADEAPEVREKEKVRRRLTGRMTHADIVEEWMGLKAELDAKISREEVQEIAKCVMEHLSAFIPGCEYTLTGGYRRGKPHSSDVDIVFCPPEEDQDIGLLRSLYGRLTALGIITHVLSVTHREADAPIKAHPNNFDNLDKAFVIFRLPGRNRLHRRVDLISAPKERYAAAVLSWSGSIIFERDLKRYAEAKGYKFRAGLVEITTGREINLETEREIFAFLGLRYVPPALRNADG